MIKKIGMVIFLSVMSLSMTGMAMPFDITIHQATPNAAVDAGNPFNIAPGTTLYFSLHFQNMANATNGSLFNITKFQVTGTAPLAAIALNYTSNGGPVIPGSVFGFIRNGTDGSFVPPDGGFVMPDAFNITVPANAVNGSTWTFDIGFDSLNESDNASATRSITAFIPAANISGYKINDSNGNGVWNPGELGIQNWNISLWNGTTNAFITSTLTDANGFYQFTFLPAGSYIVKEEDQAGWIHTNATSKSIILAGSDITNLNFTNQLVPIVPPANISGYKINDSNGNGVWDPGELVLQNWQITLLNGTNTIGSTLTDANGFYQFTNLPADSYVVIEENRAGWIHTNTSSKSIILAGSDITNLNFTNMQPRTKVPAVTPFGLVALSVMLGLIAAVAIRRRL